MPGAAIRPGLISPPRFQNKLIPGQECLIKIKGQAICLICNAGGLTPRITGEPARLPMRGALIASPVDPPREPFSRRTLRGVRRATCALPPATAFPRHVWRSCLPLKPFVVDPGRRRGLCGITYWIKEGMELKRFGQRSPQSPSGHKAVFT